MSSQQKTPVRRISLEDAKHQMEDVVFVDVRSATSEKKSPAGAHRSSCAPHVPLKELEERAKRLPRDRTLVTYCT